MDLIIVVCNYLTLEEILSLTENNVRLRNKLINKNYTKFPDIHDETKFGNFKTVKYLIEEQHFKYKDKIYEDDEDCDDRSNILDYATISNNSELIKYLIETRNVKPDKYTLQNVIYKNNLDLAKYLILQQKVKCSYETLYFSALHKKWDMVIYLIDEQKIIPSSDILDLVSEGSNDLNLVKYIISNGKLKPTYNTLGSAILSQNLEITNYFIEEFNIKFVEYHLICGAKSGNLEYFKYLIKRFKIKPTLHTLKFVENSEIIEYLSNKYGLYKF